MTDKSINKNPTEQELQTFLKRVVPGFPEDCAGATEEQVAQLDELSGGRLPPFYRWFLQTMGGDLGPFQTMLGDFAVGNVLDEHEMQTETPPGLFLIAAPEYDDDDPCPTAMYYDLDCPLRDDALVLIGPLGDVEADPLFETLREKIAHWSAFIFRIRAAPHYCKGEILGDEQTVSDAIESVLAKIGFVAPIAPQRYTKVLERDNATLICRIFPDATNMGRYFFRLGGADLDQLQSIVAEISNETSLEVLVNEWKHRS